LLPFRRIARREDQKNRAGSDIRNRRGAITLFSTSPAQLASRKLIQFTLDGARIQKVIQNCENIARGNNRKTLVWFSGISSKQSHSANLNEN